MKKIIARACNIATTLILVIIISIVLALTIPRLFHYDVLAVLSGSMEPVYHVGSVIYVDTGINYNDIKINDVITFKTDNDTVVTHRVMEIDKNEEVFRTKGDANDIMDSSPVRFENLLGKAKFTIPLIGYIAVNIKTTQGILLMAALFLIIILLQLIPEIMKKEEGEVSNEPNK